MAILVLIRILFQVVTKLDHKFNKQCFVNYCSWCEKHPVGNASRHVSWVISSLFFIYGLSSLNLLGCALWGYYSWCDKLPVGSRRGLSAIGGFPF